MLKTILVALDHSEMSSRVIEAVKLFPLKAETRIILVHVIPSSTIEGGEVSRPHLPQEALYQSIEKQLNRFQAQLTGQVSIEIVVGEPAQEIIRLANIYHTNLIILGTRGLKGMEKIIEGSVSSQVVDEANCSVLVVK